MSTQADESKGMGRQIFKFVDQLIADKSTSFDALRTINADRPIVSAKTNIEQSALDNYQFTPKHGETGQTNPFKTAAISSQNTFSPQSGGFNLQQKLSMPSFNGFDPYQLNGM